MLKDYHEKLGLLCNAHTFRRTFASNLHRKGVDVEHIMRLGGWETLDMVVRYTRSVKFEDSLKVYERAMKWPPLIRDQPTRHVDRGYLAVRSVLPNGCF